MKENINVAEMKQEIEKNESQVEEEEEEGILDAVLEEWMELNPDRKVEIA